MKMRKKIFSILLMVAMVVTYMPYQSFAATKAKKSNTKSIAGKVIKKKAPVKAGEPTSIVIAKATASGKNKIALQWQKTPGASLYDVYAVAGAKDPAITSKNLAFGPKNATKATVTKVSKKTIKTKTINTFVVRALNSSKQVMAQSKNLVVVAGTTDGKK